VEISEANGKGGIYSIYSHFQMKNSAFNLTQSDNRKNYYSAYSYVVKNDPDFVISPGLIDLLANAEALASTSARDPPKQESCTGFQKYVTKGTRSIRRCTHYTTQS
jgi:hypothetical protein